MIYSVEYRDFLSNERVLLETDDVLEATRHRDMARDSRYAELVSTNLAPDYSDLVQALA